MDQFPRLVWPTPQECCSRPCSHADVIETILVAVHRHSLRVSAELAVGGRADGSAASTTVSTAFLESKQLLGTEGLVVDLRGGLDEVLEVVSLVLDVDDTPSVLAAANLLTVDDDRLLGSDNSEGDEVLLYVSIRVISFNTLLVIKLIVVVGIHFEIVEGKLLLDALLELLTLLNSQGVGLGDDRHHVDNVGKLLQDDNIDGLERVA
ncbi:hypothetical protein HG531_006471 [Fusarium graminearum]|nr:hypothetical protein HG531_006471 [Fusarium graminearum]